MLWFAVTNCCSMKKDSNLIKCRCFVGRIDNKVPCRGYLNFLFKLIKQCFIKSFLDADSFNSNNVCVSSKYAQIILYNI